MRIGIEAQRLFRRKKHGMDIVALELIRNLERIDNQNDYYIFVKPGSDRCFKSTNRFKLVELYGEPYPLWEQFLLPLAAAYYKCDILHCTGNTAPLISTVPVILTLHDIFYLENISLFRKGFSTYQKFGNMYRRFVVPLVVKRSQKVVTVSHSEKNRITGYFHNIDDRLSVIYNGLSNRFIPVTDTELLNKTKRAYGLPEKFIFLLGNTDPKKNTKGVLTAYAKYRGLSKNPILLVIADFPEASLDAILTQQGIRDILSNIIRLDYINNQDLPAIFSLSTLFIYPSFWESFGIPILEAMACNTAVITSNVFSMPEIAGDAALLVDPKDPDHMANAMISLSTDEKLAAEMRKKGLVQAKLFSSKKMASEYLEIYRQVIHERNRKL